METGITRPLPGKQKIILRENLLALSLVTQACHFQLNQLMVPPNPKSEWWGIINEDVDNLKKQASYWVNEIGVKLISTGATIFVDFATTYMGFINEASEIAKNNPNSTGDDQYAKEVTQILNSVCQNVDDIGPTVSDAIFQTSKWAANVQSLNDKLMSDINSIMDGNQPVRECVNLLQDSMDNLISWVHQKNEYFFTHDSSQGDTISYIWVTLSLAEKAGDSSQQPGSIAIPFALGNTVNLALGGDGAPVANNDEWQKEKERIISFFKDAAVAYENLDDMQQSLVDLLMLKFPSSMLADYIVESSKDFNELCRFFTNIQQEMTEIVQELSNGVINLGRLSSEFFTAESLASWNDACGYVENLSGIRLNGFPVTIVIRCS